ncbi:MAG TPA: hypothetical protein VF220_03730 [Nitrososphaeraceae archaeon]
MRLDKVVIIAEKWNKYEIMAHDCKGEGSLCQGGKNLQSRNF